MAQGLLGGVLPAIYSGADQLKRGVYGLLTNPQEQAQRAAQSLLQSRAERQALMGQAFANPDRPFQVTNQAALGQLGTDVLMGELGIAPVGMIAYHGSPAIFSQFDKSKIGSGSGNDFGYGGYFSEIPETAKGYAVLPNKSELIRLGDKVVKTESPEGQLLNDVYSLGRKAAIKKYPDQAEYIKSINPNDMKFEGGNLYKTDIPDEYVPKMINWSSSEQPKEVNEILKKAGLPTNIRGEDIYFAAIDRAGSSDAQKSGFQKASEYLNSIGIKGITYPQRSYDTDAVTKNFVVFDPTDVKILERNNQPVQGLLNFNNPKDFAKVQKTLGKDATEFEVAQKIAQKNATLPIEEGGLALPKNNTSSDRAKAMGFETPVYHGTNADINAFNVEGKGKTSGAGAFVTTNPTAAETYVSASGDGNILPLLMRKEDFLTANARGRNWADIYTNQLGAKSKGKRYTPEELGLDINSATSTDELAMIAKDLGLSGAEIKNVRDLGMNSHVMRAKDYLLEKYGIVPEAGWSNVTGQQFAEAQEAMKKFYESQKADVYALQDPSLLRSRFAAFDPARKGETGILAGMLPFGLLTSEDDK